MTAFGHCGDALLTRRGRVRPERRRNRPGPPVGLGLEPPAILAKAVELLRRDGEMPTQAAVADALRVTGRWVSRKCEPIGGWQAIVDRVSELVPVYALDERRSH
jgi:hypothetical protein